LSIYAKYISPTFIFAGTTKDKIDDPILYESAEAKNMPVEIFDVDNFIEIAERAEYCNIKRLERVVKLKLRTPSKLFTLKVNPTNAEEIIKKLRCEIREI
jgi:ferritin-like protein